MEKDCRKIIVEIDLSFITNTEELHSLLKEKLNFPDFYGMNWSAFWDSITGLVELPEKLILIGFNEMEKKLPDEAYYMKYYLNKYEEKFNKYIKCDIIYK